MTQLRTGQVQQVTDLAERKIAELAQSALALHPPSLCHPLCTHGHGSCGFKLTQQKAEKSFLDVVSVLCVCT